VTGFVIADITAPYSFAADLAEKDGEETCAGAQLEYWRKRRDFR
jgi:hypothetical protein